MPIEISWSSRPEDTPAGSPSSGRVVLDGRGPFNIGRSSANQVVLSHPQISRTHVVLTVDQRTVRINDQGSQNKTYLDGKPVTQTTWAPEQEMRIGPFNLRYRHTDASNQRRAPAPNDDTRYAADAPVQPADARPGAVAPRAAFPGRIFEQRIVSIRELVASGKVAGETSYMAIGGGIGSFCWVDHLRVFGVPANAIRVIGLAGDKRPYAKWGRLCKVSQIPDHERIRSNSISAPDNIWGFPGYASRETVRELKRGNIGGLKYVLQVFGEPNLTESYTPRTVDVYRSFDRETRRIGWEGMWLYGQVVGIRKTDDERFAIAYRVPSEFAPDLAPEQRERIYIARYIQISTGYPASNFLPDLQKFRSENPEHRDIVVNAYEEHEDVYRQLEAKGGTVLIRGRGIVASRVIQRVFEAREKNKDIRLLHLMRTPIARGHKYDLATRVVRNDVEQQPFNWPKACWGGTLRARLETASPEERAKLMRDWGGTTTADRDDWNRMIEAGTREGWYKVFYGNVSAMSEKGGRIVTRLESTDRYLENVDLTADFIVDCTGLVARVDETPILKDVIATYDLPRNNAAGEGAELRLAGLTVTNSFEIAGLQNGRARAWAAGVVTASGPYAAVDSFLGLQFAALRSVDHLGALGAPGVSRFGPLRSISQWLKWCAGSSP